MKNGFTIIELIISIFVLSVAVVGVFSAFSMVTILTSDATDRLIATYLAQEGAEIVRNIRDTNWLNMDAVGCVSEAECPVSWLYGLDNCNTPSGCGADYNSNYLDSSQSGYLCIDEDSGFYMYNAVNCFITKFKRKITIIPIADVNNQLNDHIRKVVVQVSWDKKATILGGEVLADQCQPSNCITTEVVLYDWYNYAYH